MTYTGRGGYFGARSGEPGWLNCRWYWSGDVRSWEHGAAVLDSCQQHLAWSRGVDPSTPVEWTALLEGDTLVVEAAWAELALVPVVYQDVSIGCPEPGCDFKVAYRDHPDTDFAAVHAEFVAHTASHTEALA